MKKSITALTVLSVIACILIWMMGTSTEIRSAYRKPEDELVFRIAVTHDEGHPAYEGVEAFVQLVEEKTDGRVTIIIYDEEVFGDEAAIVEQLAFGGIDFARISGVYLDQYSEMIRVMCLPGLYEDRKEMMKVFNNDELSTMLSESLKNEKINVLTVYPGSIRGICHSSDDLVNLYGKKVAVPESQMKMAEIEVLGFQPVPSLADHVNSYFTSGYIDGAEGELLEYYYNRNFNRADSFTVTSSMIPEVIIASNTALKQLTVEEQKIIREAAVEAGLISYDLIISREREILKELQALGIKATLMEENPMHRASADTLVLDTRQVEILEKIKGILDE